DRVADQFRVGIEQEKIIRGRVACGEIDACGETKVRARDHELHLRKLLAHDRNGVVGRPVVDDHDLLAKASSRDEYTVQAARDLVRGVVGDNENGNVRLHASTPSG